MKCSDIYDEMGDYINFRLDETEVRHFEEHMQSCPSCQKDFEKLEKIIFSLKNISDIDEPTYLKENIMEKIYEKDSKKTFNSIKWVSFACVAVFMVVIYNKINFGHKMAGGLPQNTESIAKYSTPFGAMPHKEESSDTAIIPNNEEKISYIYEKTLKREKEDRELVHHLVLNKGEKCSVYIENKQKGKIDVYFKDMYDNIIGKEYTIDAKKSQNIIFDTPLDALDRDVYVVDISSKDKKYIDAYVKIMVMTD